MLSERTDEMLVQPVTHQEKQRALRVCSIFAYLQLIEFQQNVELFEGLGDYRIHRHKNDEQDVEKASRV